MTDKTEGTESGPGIAGVKHIIAVGSGKGGVGKSTVAVNLAVALTATGARVGLMDADIYGPSQPQMLGSADEEPDVSQGFLKPLIRHGVKFVSMGVLMEGNGPVIWRAPMATKMIQQFIHAVEWGDLDYLLIDLPPGTGDVQLTLAQQASLSGAIIVTTPQQVALGVAEKGLRMFSQVNVPVYGIIENMSGFVCGHCHKETKVFGAGGGERMARQLEVPYLGSLPLDPAIMNSGDTGNPVLEHAPNSDAAAAVSRLAVTVKETIERLENEISQNEPSGVELDSDGRLKVDWPDGTSTVHTAYHLRQNCHCAECRDEDTGKRLIDPKQIPLDIRIENTRAVGRYGLSIQFSDGHNTGIYAYQRLRTLDESGEKPAQFSV